VRKRPTCRGRGQSCATNLKVGGGVGGVNALEGGRVNTVKTLTFEKGGCMTFPAPMVAPPLGGATQAL